MNEDFITFKVLPDKETAEGFAAILQERKIPFLIEEDSLVFDPSYANNPLNKDYLLKVKQKDFAATTKAYEDYFSALLDTVSKDHYLFSFSNEELKEIVAKPDEWGSLDYLLSQQILKQRGISISEEEKKALKAKRYQELAKPEKETAANVLGYYIVSILFFPVGIIIGWIWGHSKKNLPNGERVYAYNANVRKHGQILFAIAIALFVLTILWEIAATLPGK